MPVFGQIGTLKLAAHNRISQLFGCIKFTLLCSAPRNMSDYGGDEEMGDFGAGEYV